MDHIVKVQRYWMNRLLCRHGSEYRQLLHSSNGVVSYCGKCYRKHTGIHDFGTKGYETK